MLAEQFLAGGPKFQLYDSSTQHWEQLMNWQHTTMYLFFAIAGAISLTVHSTDIAPLALDRMLLGLAFFNEGRILFLFFFWLFLKCMCVLCRPWTEMLLVNKYFDTFARADSVQDLYFVFWSLPFIVIFPMHLLIITTDYWPKILCERVFYKWGFWCWRMCGLLPKLSTLCYSWNDMCASCRISVSLPSPW